MTNGAFGRTFTIRDGPSPDRKSVLVAGRTSRRSSSARPACGAFRAGDRPALARLARRAAPSARAAVLQAGQAFLPEAVGPFAARARANAYGFTGGLRRLPTDNHSCQPPPAVRPH